MCEEQPASVTNKREASVKKSPESFPDGGRQFSAQL